MISNVFFFLLKNDTLVTPDLKDTVLPGITRESVLILSRDMGLKTEERQISIQEAMDSAKEVFVTGTAAGVTHFGSITHRDKTIVFNNGEIGETTLNLQKELKGIQYGLIDDRHGWMYTVN